MAPGLLQGGAAYTFSVQMVPEDDPAAAATATARVILAAKGVEARTPSKELTFSAGSAISLDGSLSVDKDNKPGELKVRNNFAFKCIMDWTANVDVLPRLRIEGRGFCGSWNKVGQLHCCGALPRNKKSVLSRKKATGQTEKRLL